MFALTVGGDQVLIRNGARCAVVPRPDLELLNSCTRFATLEAHAHALANELGAPAEARKVLQLRLEELARRGLLDRASLVARGGTSQVEVSQRICMVTIPTRDRPDVVARAVRSVAQAARRASRRIDCLVINDGDEGLRLPALDDVRTIVVGRREREQLAEILASESGAPAEIARRVVLGDPVHGWRSGAVYNTALLLAAGQAFLSIDDDVILRLAASPMLKPGACATSIHDPTAFWFFRDRVTALAIQPADVDPFEAVERVLGRSAGTVLDGAPDAPWLDDISPSLAAALGAGRARVAATSFGAIGDSGMGMWNVRYYLHLRGTSLRRAAPDDATWAWVRTTRAVLRATDRVVLSGGMHFMSMAIGLDHRGFLPPFPPAGYDADQLFCSFLRHCSDDALIAHLPWAVFHDPPGARAVPESRPGLLRLGDPVRWVVQLQGTGFAIPPEDRLRALGAALEQRGRLPPSAFEEFMRLGSWKRWSHEITMLEAQLGSTPTPAFTADLRRDIAALRARLLETDAPVPIELSDRPVPEALATMQRYLVRLGESLSSWPALVAAARHLPTMEMIIGR